MLFYLNQKILKLDAIAMMAEDGMKRFPFFKKIGAFSVNPGSRRSLIESLSYAAEQLKNEKHLFLFPQGNETHLEKRPFNFFSGAGYLHDKAPSTPVIPVVFYHGLFHHQLPEWFIHIGEPITFPAQSSRKEKTYLFEKAAEHELEYLKKLVILDDPSKFRVLLRGKKGIGQHWEGFKGVFQRGKHT